VGWDALKVGSRLWYRGYELMNYVQKEMKLPATAENCKKRSWFKIVFGAKAYEEFDEYKWSRADVNKRLAKLRL